MRSLQLQDMWSRRLNDAQQNRDTKSRFSKGTVQNFAQLDKKCSTIAYKK